MSTVLTVAAWAVVGAVVLALCALFVVDMYHLLFTVPEKRFNRWAFGCFVVVLAAVVYLVAGAS